MKGHKLNLLVILIGFLTIGEINGQSFSQTSSINRNKYSINKAYGGISGKTDLFLTYRTQWQGGAGVPKTIMANINTPVYPLQGGVGINVKSETIGNQEFFSGGFSYNYVYDGDIGLISGGLGLSVFSHDYDPSNATTPDGYYQNAFNFINDDPLLQTQDFMGMSIEPSLFYAFDFLEVGLSMHKFLTGPDQIVLGTKPTFQFFAEYQFTLPNGIDITPLIYLKNQGNKTQVELHAESSYNERILLGLGFRGYSANSIDATIFNVGFRLSPNLSFNYYYDLGISSYASALDGSHEILLKYQFDNNIFTTKRVKRIYNPRYLE